MAKQLQIKRPVKTREVEDIDTRTPSGKILPY